MLWWVLTGNGHLTEGRSVLPKSSEEAIRVQHRMEWSSSHFRRSPPIFPACCVLGPLLVQPSMAAPVHRTDRRSCHHGTHVPQRTFMYALVGRVPAALPAGNLDGEQILRIRTRSPPIFPACIVLGPSLCSPPWLHLSTGQIGARDIMALTSRSVPSCTLWSVGSLRPCLQGILTVIGP